MNFPVRIPFVAFHKFWSLCLFLFLSHSIVDASFDFFRYFFMFLFICSLIHGCSVACCSTTNLWGFFFFFQFSSCNQFLVSYYCGWKSAWYDFLFLTLRIFLWLNIWSNLSNVLWAFEKIMYIVTFALLWLFSH